MLPILPKTEQQIQEKKRATPIFPTKKIPVVTKKAPTKSPLPTILFATGMLLLLSQVIPLILSFLTGISLSQQNGIFVPVSAQVIEQLTAVRYIDPGEQYLTAVISENTQPVINTSYSKAMKLSLVNSDISRVQLTPNVPGNKAEVYDEVLKHGVAHLKGTSVPGDPGLSVIYGHSGVSNFFSGKNNPQIIFSRLDTVSIGDTMTIERDGKELSYVVSGKKIVDPQDLSFMDQASSRERAVLITCWPLGIGTKRLIVMADRLQ